MILDWFHFCVKIFGVWLYLLCDFILYFFLNYYSRVSMIVNFNIQDFNLSPSHTVIPLFWPLMTGFYGQGWDHVAAELAGLTVLLLCRSLSIHSSCVSHKMRFIAYVLYGISLPFSCIMFFMLPKSVCILLKISFSAWILFEDLWYFYYWYCESCNQIGILHWNWYPVVVTVS